jgi:transposase-like protein
MKPTPINQSEITDTAGADMGSTQGAHRATGVEPMSGDRKKLHRVSVVPPDPEVPEKKRRRKFTAKYKLRILSEADLCTQPGQVGDLLRREGLYSSHLTTWRRQKEEGLLDALSPKKRGRKKKPTNPFADKVARLEKDNRRLQQKLKQAELIIEAQKKMSEILGISQNLEESDETK